MIRPEHTKSHKLNPAPLVIAALRDFRIRAVLTLLSFILLGSSQKTSLGAGAVSLSAQAQQNQNIRVISLNDSAPPFHPSRILVRFKGEAGPRVIPTPNPIAAIGRYRADNSVLYEPDYVLHVDTTTPTDPLWPQQWDMAKISAPQACGTLGSTRAM